MKKCLVFLFGAGCILLTLDFLMGVGMRRIPTSETGVLNRAMTGRIDAELLVTGSSRAEYDYDPRILGRATGLRSFIVGRRGTRPDLQLPILHSYLRYNSKPTLVVQNLDVTSLALTKDIYVPGQYTVFLKEPELYDALSKLNPDTWKSKYVPLYGFLVDGGRFTTFQAMSGLLGVFPKEDHFDGYLPMKMSWGRDLEMKRKQYPQGFNPGIEVGAKQVIVDIIKLCLTHGIPIVLVYPPEYIEFQKMTVDRSTMISFYQRISDEHGIQFLDYSNHPICMRTEYFYDAQHMNDKGAEQFSEELGVRLATEILRGSLKKY